MITNHNVHQSQITLTSVLDQEKFRNPPWWNRRTRLERTLCALSTVTLVMCLAMTISLAILGYHYQPNDYDFHSSPSADHLISETNQKPNAIGPGQPEKLCLTKGCVKAAAYIVENMDDSVDPCQDFYKFACGNWVEKQNIPDDRTSVSIFSLLENELNTKLRSLIEKKAEPNEPDFYTKLRNLYASCMNLDEIENVGNKPVTELLQSLGGWPVLESNNWNADKFDWIDTLIQFRKLGFSVDIIYDLSITPDFRNNTFHIIDLDQASLGMPDRSYLLKGENDTTVAGYFSLMVESAVMLGADRKYAEQEMREALYFEMLLANYSLPREERRNMSSLYNKMTISDIEKMAPNTDWMKYFNQLINQDIKNSEKVLVNVPSFVEKVDAAIPKVEKRVLANYMLWRCVLQCFTTLGRKWRDAAQGYSKIITGQDREEPRWEQCLSSLTGSLGIAFSSLYVKHYFKEDSKKAALQLVNYIHKEFIHILEKIDWMDPETIKKAIEKAESISPFIGYPAELLDDEKVGNLYKDLILTKDNYFENVRRLRRWSIDYAFSQLRKENKKGDWRKHARAVVVNAYYNALENSIEFPAGILQGAFFDSSRPLYLNYGAIGFVIGHEITHGFDDRGRQFDKDGNNLNWWHPETDAKFKEKAECIIKQYSNYTISEYNLRINGINTQGENIADNGGLKEAYRAYKKWEKDHGKEPQLPGLPYTNDQLFWISAANVWCGKYRPEVIKLRVTIGSHSPSQFRVVGPMSNIEEFAKSFNCPLGSPMNPAKKCEVW